MRDADVELIEQKRGAYRQAREARAEAFAQHGAAVARVVQLKRQEAHWLETGLDPRPLAEANSPLDRARAEAERTMVASQQRLHQYDEAEEQSKRAIDAAIASAAALERNLPTLRHRVAFFLREADQARQQAQQLTHRAQTRQTEAAEAEAALRRALAELTRLRGSIIATEDNAA